MNSRSLAHPSHVLDAWWKEVSKKIAHSCVYMDDEMSESLHWHGGIEKLINAGVKSIKEFSSFEECTDTKAVFFVSSVIQDVTENILKDIITGSKLDSITLICAANPAVQTYAKYGDREDIDEHKISAQLEHKILHWLGNQNASVEMYSYPLLLLPVLNKLFLLPKFSKIFPILETDLPVIRQELCLNRQADGRFLEDISALQFEHLPMQMRIEVRHMVAFFHNLFQAMNVREEIFSLGHTAGLIATELDTYNPARLRRRTAEGKVSLVLVDRTMDLVQPSSHRHESLFDRMMTILPRLPGHKVDSHIDMSPLTDLHPDCHWSLLPGCLHHSNEDIATLVFEKLICSHEKEAFQFMKQTLCEIVPNDDDDSNETLMDKIKKLASDKDSLMAHLGLIQQTLGVLEARNSASSNKHYEVYALEKMYHQLICSREQSFQEVIYLMDSRKQRNLDIENVYSLMLNIVSLGDASVLDESLEYTFIDSLSKAILEDQHCLPAIIKESIGVGIDELSALKAAKKMWGKLWSISRARQSLKNYQALHSKASDETPGSYEGLLPQLIKACLSGTQNDIADLEYKSSGFKNMIKSGFSLFVNVSKPTPREAEMMMVYVVGGITAAEVSAMRTIIEQQNPACEVIIGSSHFTHPKDILNNILQPSFLL